MLDVQQGGVPAHQGRGKRVRHGQTAGRCERLVRQPAGLRGLGEDEVLREPREHAHAKRAVGWSERREGLFEQVGVAAVTRHRGVEATADAQRGAREPVSRAEPARELEGLAECRARRRIAGLPASLTEREQQVAARRGIVTSDQR